QHRGHGTAHTVKGKHIFVVPGGVAEVKKQVGRQGKDENKKHAHQRKRGEFDPVLKEGKQCRRENAEGARQQKGLVQLLGHPVQEERVGRHLVGGDKNPHEKSGSQHQPDLLLFYRSYLQGPYETIRHKLISKIGKKKRQVDACLFVRFLVKCSPGITWQKSYRSCCLSSSRHPFHFSRPHRQRSGRRSRPV